MRQAIPYPRDRKEARAPQPTPESAGIAGFAGDDKIAKAVTENPVVVVGRRGCCMVHVVRRLLQGQGVDPAVCEVSDNAEEAAAAAAAGVITNGVGNGRPTPQQELQLPAVFIGGNLVGGLDRLMAVHISGELVPILRDAGALWL